ncbi:MAG: hypothetical protein PUE54_10545, partial [Bacteroidales bacterium]|nr:hypothetical protein [Bacteroidales bacterium]
FGDGTTAKTLTYAVYEEGQQHPLIVKEDEVAFSAGLTTTVNLRLANGKKYDLVFWADAADAPYTFDADNKTVTVNYTAAVGQDEKRDAFFAHEDALHVTGTINKTIKLKRPFAQLNIGATDYAEATDAAFTTASSAVKVNHVANAINIRTGVATGDETITFADAPVPDDSETFHVTGVDADYLAMNYLLVNDTKQLVDVEFTAKSTKAETITRSYANVPVQRNYRTNIYGNILTEEANFNIEIIPGFNEPANNVPVFETTVSNQEQMEDALATDAENIIININGSASFDKSSYYAQFGGASTKTITIDGGEAGAELNIVSNYRNHIVTKNNATIILKNLTVSSNYAVNGSTWDDYGIIFECPTVMENVTFTRQLVLGKNQKHELTNVTINQTSATGDMYALWLEAGVDVTLKDCVINSINPSGAKNRAIKIADEYITNPQLTKLAVSGTTFKSQKKAAVLVTSTAGANIVWGEGNDISQVQADNVNAVWNDADRTAAWDLVTVTGCTKKQEE